MSPIEQLEPFTWLTSQLGEVINLLAQKSGFNPKTDVMIKPPNFDESESQALDEWIDMAANVLGIESEPVSTPYNEVETLLNRGGAALLRLPNKRFLGLLPTRFRWRGVKIIAPNGSVHRISLELIRGAFCYSLEVPLEAEIQPFLTTLPHKRRAKARHVMLQEHLQKHKLDNCWLLRLPPSASLWTQLRHARLPLYFFLSVGSLIIQNSLHLAIFSLIGKSTVENRIDWVWLWAIILILISVLPFVLGKTWVDSLFAVGLGQVLKKRLFYGVLHLSPDEIQVVGMGTFLAWAMESERLEEASVGGWLLVLNSGITLMVMTLALMLIGELLLGVLLCLWLFITTLISWRFFQDYFAFNQYNSEITRDFQEQLRAHQTRLVQEKNWHDKIDKLFAHYLELRKKTDQRITELYLVPGGWTVVGLLGSAMTFIQHPESTESLVVSLFIVLFTIPQLGILSKGMTDVIRAATAWKLIRPLIQATTLERDSTLAGPDMELKKNPPVGSLILDAQGLTFRYQARGRAILQECDLEIRTGDRILLEGPSGGGKSTLASLLIGLNTPESGLLLLHGLDWQTIGPSSWRQRIVSAPQFHENHIFSATLAFNLLMGRRWPPLAQDLIEAEEILRELGLGDLLDRMPFGLQQLVGEEGWRLSQGECSRLYIARALLQGADLIILDESFASLDPENMEIALRCVLKRAPTLFVIAHP